MSFDTQKLLTLLPPLYRLRDQGGTLEALLTVLAEQIAVVEENLDQLYDDQFIETCAPWAVPYIGDLIGYRLVHGKARGAGSRRAEIAHTIGFRRRKGTASMLERLADDVTGWNARAVEYFRLLAITQYMNHKRLGNVYAPDLRDGLALERIGTAFDAVPHTLDVRRIVTQRGRYNIPNVGIFLWRIGAHRLARSPATAEPGDPTGRRFRFSPLGHDIPLYTLPAGEEDIAQFAEPINVPAPISRRQMHARLADCYGDGKSLAVWFDGILVPVGKVCVCNLSDAAGGWAHEAPSSLVAIDPQLGRLAIAADVALPARVSVTHHYGAPGELGGGEYGRLASFVAPDLAPVRVPDDHATLQAAINALGGEGVVEITNNGRYAEAIQIDVSAAKTIELRAANGRWPTLELTAPMILRGGDRAGVVLNGLLIAGDLVQVPAAGHELRRLDLRHVTLVPGRRLLADGRPEQPGAASLEVDRADVEVRIERSIVGAIRVAPGATVAVADSIIDACARTVVAYAAIDGAAAGAPLAIRESTVIGETRAAKLDASNAILLGSVSVERRQKGCARFSFLPLESAVPRRHRCQPAPPGGAGNVPHFTSLRYGVPGYCQLGPRTPQAIARGADDESEMGVYHFLFQPQRESDLATRLDEYLRVGLQAGIFHES